MILVDANLLLYAEDSLSEHHEAARSWWDAQLSGADPVDWRCARVDSPCRSLPPGQGSVAPRRLDFTSAGSLVTPAPAAKTRVPSPCRTSFLEKYDAESENIFSSERTKRRGTPNCHQGLRIPLLPLKGKDRLSAVTASRRLPCTSFMVGSAWRLWQSLNHDRDGYLF